MQFPVPSSIREVHHALKKAGYEAYLVGGCVRDLILNRTPKDWDITTNATPEVIQGMFSESFYENEFGTVGVVTDSTDPRLKVVEITPFRAEGKYSNARHPDHISWATTLSEDLKRRDFTINAMAYDPDGDALVDEHDGVGDVRRKIVRCVGEPDARFGEDALRMLRAIRIATELDFAIESATALGIAAQSGKLGGISRERVRDEFVRIIESDRPMQAIFVAKQLNVLPHIVPQLVDAIGCAQNQAHSYDVFEHLVRSMQYAADNHWPLDVRLAALFHDIGKPATRRWSDEKKDWTFYGHDVVGERLTKKIMQELRFPKEISRKVSTLVRWHMFFSDPETITLSAVRRLITRVGKENIHDLINLRVCDRIGTGRPKAHPFRLRKYMSMVDEALRDPLSVSMLQIDGNTLIGKGERPGPRIGWILHALFEEILDDPSKNTLEYLETRTEALMLLDDDALRVLGEGGKERRNDEEKAAIEDLRAKHGVR